MYKNYIFDLYGTLVDIRTNENKENLWKGMAELYRNVGAVYEAEELKRDYFLLCREEEERIRREKECEYPEIEIGEVFRKLYMRKNVRVGEETAVYAARRFRQWSREYIRVYEGAAEMLAELKRIGRRVFLLSNAQRLFTMPEIETLGIEKFFDDIFISSDYGVKKPERAYMELLLKKQHLKTKDCVMIGNELGSDIEIANACGMDSLFLQGNVQETSEKGTAATYVAAEGDFEHIRFIYDWKEDGK
ncbi:HAD family hydrolase [Kineothrix sedimenti]|uniref:HAD family hydrolase n=1 Tax=Kineothrix sedimenti TaxID=3123317 RepID=A0ABZ3EZR5_9FIRM